MSGNPGQVTNNPLTIYKIDPVAIVRPGRLAVVMYINAELPGHTAMRIDDVDVSFTPSARIEGNELAVWRPVRRSGHRDAE